MSPNNIKNRGGNLGRAESCVANSRDAARADDIRMLAPGVAVLACAGAVLVFGAPELWPQLFAQ